MARFFIDHDLSPDLTISLSAALSHRLQQVLRAKAGDQLVVFNGRGGEFDATIETLHKKGGELRIAAFHEVSRESSLPVTLIQGVSRGNRMDYTIQKAVELGVQSIVPVITSRSTVQLKGDRATARLQHWLGVIHHACEQCGRTKVPDLTTVIDFETLLNHELVAHSFLLDTQTDQPLDLTQRPTRSFALIAGPEGGFTDAERSMLCGVGAKSIRLGPRVLRTETAAITALSILQAHWGDLL